MPSAKMTVEQVTPAAISESGQSCIRVLTTHPKVLHPEWDDAQTTVLPGWLEVASRAGEKSLSPARSLYWGWKLFRASRKFDVVITGFERPWHVFALLQKTFRRKRKHHFFIYFGLQRPNRLWYYRKIVDSCARVVVHSRHQVDLYARTIGVNAEKFACVFYHTTLHGYHGVRADLLPVQKGDYIFSGGGFRDYATLLEAVSGLPCRTVIATRDQSYFRDLQIPSNVEIVTASHEEFFQLMAGARAVVLPLHGQVLHPGGEQSYLNAMAMGKPVVVAADFGADEYITNGVDGMVVPAGQPSALRDALRSLLGNRRLADAMGDAAKRTAGKYSAEQFIRGVRAVVYDTLARNP
jgi:glycosyltransferase involved in cell wall biosynthesis